MAWYLKNTTATRFGATRYCLDQSDASAASYVRGPDHGFYATPSVKVELFTVDSSGAATLRGSKQSTVYNDIESLTGFDVVIASDIAVPAGGGVMVRLTALCDVETSQSFYSPAMTGYKIPAGTHTFWVSVFYVEYDYVQASFGAQKAYGPDSIMAATSTNWSLGGSLAGGSSLSADLSQSEAQWNLEGALTSASSSTGSLIHIPLYDLDIRLVGVIFLAGGISSSSALEGDLSQTDAVWSLGGSLIGNGDLAAALSKTEASWALAGSLVGDTDIYADLSHIEASWVLAGSFTEAADFSADLSQIEASWALIGILSESSSLVAQIIAARQIIGLFSSSSSFSASLTQIEAQWSLAGTLSTQSLIESSIWLSMLLNGSLPSSSSFNADLSHIEAQWALAGNIPGLSSIVGIESVQRALSALAAGTSIGNAQLSVNLAMLGGLLGSSSSSGQLGLVHANWSLTSQISSAGILEATPTADRFINGALTGDTSLSANLSQIEAQWELSGDIVGSSSSNTNLSQIEAQWSLSGNLVGTTINLKPRIFLGWSEKTYSRLKFFRGWTFATNSADLIQIEAQWSLIGDITANSSLSDINLSHIEAQWELSGGMVGETSQIATITYIPLYDLDIKVGAIYYLVGTIVENSSSIADLSQIEMQWDLEGETIAASSFSADLSKLESQWSLSGDITGIGSQSANLVQTEAQWLLEGDLITISSLSADLSQTEAHWSLASNISGLSSIVGIESVQWSLLGDIVGENSLSSNLSQIEAQWSLAGSIVENSLFNASLSQIEAIWNLTGEIVSESSSSADLSQIEAQWSLNGSIAGLSSIVGIESVQRALSAAAAGTSIGNAELSVNLAMLGDYLGASSISGSLTLVHANWGLVGQVSSGGNLEAIIVADRLIEGILSSNTTLSANLSQIEAQWSLAGNINSTSFLNATLLQTDAQWSFEGEIDEISSINANLSQIQAQWSLNGEIVSDSFLEASLSYIEAQWSLAGNIAGEGSLSGEAIFIPQYDLDVKLSGILFLSGETLSESLLTGALSQIEAQWSLAGEFSSNSSLEAALSQTKALFGELSSNSLLTANLSQTEAQWSFEGEIKGESLFSSNLSQIEAQWNLLGEIISNSSLSADLLQIEVEWNLTGEIVEESFFAADLVQTKALVGEIVAISAQIGEITFIPQYDLDIKLSGIHYLEGNIESDSSFNAAETFYFEAEWILEGNIIANTIIEAKIIVDGFFAGDVVGNGILTADWLYFEAEWALAGDFGEIQSSLSGNLLQTHANWKLAGQVKSISTSNSNLSYIKELTGKIVSDSFFGTVHLSSLTELSGGMIISQTFTKEAYLYYQIGLKGSVVGDSLFNANLKASRDLVGDIIQNSALGANLSKTEAQWQLSGRIEEIISTSFANLTILHTVTFKNWNGTVLATRVINTGQNAIPPNLITREGYVFIGWSKNYFNVINSLETMAIYKIITSIVQYAVGEGGSLSGDLVQSIDYGSSGTAVTALPSPGYEFSRWSDGVLTATRIDTNVTYSKTVTAMFSSLTGGLYNADMLLYRNPLLG